MDVQQMPRRTASRARIAHDRQPQPRPQARVARAEVGQRGTARAHGRPHDRLDELMRHAVARRLDRTATARWAPQRAAHDAARRRERAAREATESQRRARVAGWEAQLLQERIDLAGGEARSKLGQLVGRLRAELTGTPDPERVAELGIAIDAGLRRFEREDGRYAELRGRARDVVLELKVNPLLAARITPHQAVFSRLFNGPTLVGGEEQAARREFNAAQRELEAARTKLELELRSVGQLAEIEREIEGLPTYRLGDDGLEAALAQARGLRDSARFDELRSAVMMGAALRKQIERLGRIDERWQDVPKRLVALGDDLGDADRAKARQAFDGRLTAADAEKAYAKAHRELVPREIAINTPKFNAVSADDAQAKGMLDTLLGERTIRAGSINSVYRTSWDTGEHDFSVEVTVEGINSIVIHAHCKRASKTGPVAITVAHWKRKGEKFAPASAHPISDDVRAAMLDRGEIERRVHGRSVKKQ